VSARSLSR